MSNLSPSNIAKTVVGCAALAAALGLYLYLFEAYEQDGFFGALIVVLIALFAVSLPAIIGFLAVEVASELDKNVKVPQVGADRPKTS